MNEYIFRKCRLYPNEAVVENASSLPGWTVRGGRGGGGEHQTPGSLWRTRPQASQMADSWSKVIFKRKEGGLHDIGHCWLVFKCFHLCFQQSGSPRMSIVTRNHLRDYLGFIQIQRAFKQNFSIFHIFKGSSWSGHQQRVVFTEDRVNVIWCIHYLPKPWRLYLRDGIDNFVSYFYFLSKTTVSKKLPHLLKSRQSVLKR